jgi:uncharacterized protein
MNNSILIDEIIGFDEHKLLHDLRHYLPTQTPLKDFIHHNTLHAFQNQSFYDAIFKASEIFGYSVTFPIDDYRKLLKNGRIKEAVLDSIINKRKGNKDFDFWKNIALNEPFNNRFAPRIGQLRANWKSKYKIDLDTLVQPLLFRILSSYLDQGIALWHFPNEDKGLLFALRELESNGYASFFKSKRAKDLLIDKSITIQKLLTIVVGTEAYFEQYVFDQQCSHRGWSGMVATIETQPDSVLYPKKIALNELIILDLLFEIDALDTNLGANWAPLATTIASPPIDLFAEISLDVQHDALMIWQDAFEWSYYNEVLSGLKTSQIIAKVENQAPPSGGKAASSFQAVFCIDEREDSLRRHIESVDVNAETLGCPGFFGVEFYFQPQFGQFYEKLCPAPVTPKYLIKELEVSEHRKHELLYTKKAHSFLEGFFISLSLGVVAAWQLILTLFRPKMSPAISDAFAHMNIGGTLLFENKNLSDVENGLQIGFTIPEMALRVENLLRGIGMITDFAPIVYITGHGSSSANNPHHGAHDCGACSGRPGSVNARVFSAMANHVEVREILAKNGLVIPVQTQFVGALHDTAADEVAFYDLQNLSKINAEKHKLNAEVFENALDLNAKERSRRFASINTKQPIKKVREAIRKRSVSLFEPRPELGHGTNALCFVGHRKLTKDLFFDRRAFMNSYDYRTDLEGQRLLGVMRPLPIVCGGINLEYYFSRMDNYKLGAGTKLPHNVVGLIGVANSSDGDLRPGLPLQMIEVHDPVRLMILVEHFPEIILKTIKTEPAVYEWFINEWVHLVAIHPETNEFHYFSKGSFNNYLPIPETVPEIRNVQQFFEDAKEMKTNNIVDATKENLPVHTLNKG